LYVDIVSNIINVMFFCGVIILIDLSVQKKYSHYVLGVIFGLITIFIMNDSITIVEGRFFDFRHLTMTMAGFIGGPVTALIAASISSLYRYNVGGSGAIGGISSLIVFGCFGCILARFKRNSQTKNKVWFWLMIGIVIEVVHLFIIAFIHPSNIHSAEVLRIVAVPFLIITPLATTIIFNFYYWAYGFFGKALILNTIINNSDMNLMIFDTNGHPILHSKNLKKEFQSYTFIENPNLLLDPDKTWLNTTKKQREIATDDGRYFVTDVSSFRMPSGEYACIGIVNDVTNRKREIAERELAREKLAKSQKDMSSILESMTDCFFAIDNNWKFLYINHAGEKAFGRSRDELLNTKITELLRLDDIALQHYHEVMSEKKSVTFELISKALGGKWLEIRAYPTETGMTCYFSDISSRKLSEKEFTRLERLNLVGQLAAGIGHEIRNPMTTVRGYLQLLGEKPDFAARRSTFELMISELDRANAIITEFLSLAQTKQTVHESLNLNDILSKLYPLLEADTFTQNKQICYIPGEIPNLQLNRKEISQLVLNLTRNGLEAMLQGGCLTVKSYVEEGQVVLAIKDEGWGIPTENLIKIGTPFYTTKDEGTGLGLAICYKIAESHNARIYFDTSSSGTTFFILFPIPDKVQG